MNKEKVVPKIRFKMFSEDLKEFKLGSITDRVRGNDGRMELLTLTISAGNGWLDQRERFSGNIAGKEQKNYTLLRKGELSYNKGNSKLAKYGVVFMLDNFEEALVPRVYHSFRVTKKASARYIEYLFATKKPDRELRKLITSGARMDGLLNINYDDFMGIKITIPKVEEQIIIGSFFNKVDETIRLQQQLLDDYKQLKKAMLQKMFPQKGESVPRVRFAGFNDDWVINILGDVVEIRRGLTYKPDDVTSNGIRVLRSSNIKEDIFELREDDVFVREGAINIKKVENGDILITAANGSTRLVGKHAIINNLLSNTVHGGFMLTITSEYNPFINAWMSSSEYKRTLEFVQGGNGSIGNLSSKTLENAKISIPSIEERQLIGKYFTKLESLISFHHEKLGTYQDLKKAMLQKMFV